MLVVNRRVPPHRLSGVARSSLILVAAYWAWLPVASAQRPAQDSLPAAAAPLRPGNPSVDLPTVAVTADLAARRRVNTPAALSTVTPRALTARDLALTPADALARVPGVTAQAGALGTHRIVIRGQGARAPFTTNRLRAYLGAIPLTDGEGNTDLEDVDLSTLGGVDVVRGPAATAYGAGLGGVILMQPDFDVPAGFAGNGEALAGGFGTYRLGAGLTYGTPADDHERRAAALRLAYQRTQSEGFRQNDTYRRDNLTALARLGEDARGHTDVQLLYAGVRGEIPSSLGATALAEDRTQAGGTWGLAEGYEAYDKVGFGVSRLQRLGERWRLVASAFGRWRDAYEPRPFDILDERTLTGGGRAVVNYEPGAGTTRLSIGGELLADRYDYATYANDFADFPAGTGSVRGALETELRERRTGANAFAQADFGLGRLLGIGDGYGGSDVDALELTLGLGVNRTRYALTDELPGPGGDVSGDYGFGVQVSPRAALRYALATDVSAFAQVARGFSPPSLAETLTPAGDPNPDIAPETGWLYELGVRGAQWRGDWSFDAVAYYMPVSDLLVARRTAEDRFVGVNAGRTRHLGLELGGSYLVGEARSAGRAAGLDVYATYTLQAHRFEDFVDGEADYSGNDLTGVPQHQGAAGADWWTRLGLEGHVGLVARGRLPVDDANEAYAEGYGVVNLRLGWRPRFAQAEGDVYVLPGLVFVGLDNALDAAYVSMVNVNAGAFGGREPRYFYPGAPRTWYVGVRLEIR